MYVIFYSQFSAFLSQFSSLTCPTQISSTFQATVDCDPAYTFKLQEYDVPLFLQVLLKLVSGVTYVLVLV